MSILLKLGRKEKYKEYYIGMLEKMKIAIVGTGYVGLSLAILLSQKNEIVVLDIVKEKVKMINNKNG